MYLLDQKMEEKDLMCTIITLESVHFQWLLRIPTKLFHLTCLPPSFGLLTPSKSLNAWANLQYVFFILSLVQNSHTSNTWTNNAAVGGRFAYWFTLPESPIGAAAPFYVSIQNRFLHSNFRWCCGETSLHSLGDLWWQCSSWVKSVLAVSHY